MAAAQPLNTAIQVFQRVRVVYANPLHRSVKAMLAPWSPRVVPAPGKETDFTETLDSAFKSDAWPNGHRVAVAPLGARCMADVVAISGMDFPVRLPGNFREVQVQKNAANITDDLHQEIRDEAANC